MGENTDFILLIMAVCVVAAIFGAMYENANHKLLNERKRNEK